MIVSDIAYNSLKYTYHISEMSVLIWYMIFASLRCSLTLYCYACVVMFLADIIAQVTSSSLLTKLYTITEHYWLPIKKK